MDEPNKMTWYSKLSVIIVFVVALGFVFYFVGDKSERGDEAVIESPMDATYIVGDKEVKFKNGVASIDATPGSASKDVFTIFGEPTYADLDKDEDFDAVMFLSQNSGGSGTFYYAIVAVNIDGSYQGTNAMFLGDRIAPQGIDFLDGRAVVNYADRKAGESFSVRPSMGKSVWIHLDIKNMEIGEFVKDFEGESNLP